MNILIILPHDSLLSPQGHRVRFEGLLKSLPDATIHLLIPDSTPAEDLKGLEHFHLWRFTEFRIGSRSIPFFADLIPSFRKAVLKILSSQAIDLCIFDFPWGLASVASRSTVPCLYFSHGVESEFAEITATHFGPLKQLLSPVLTAYISWIEQRCCAASRGILCMSERDAELLAQQYSLEPKKLCALPQPVRVPAADIQESCRSDFRQQHGISPSTLILGFHGTWAHAPNREAILLLRDVVTSTLEKEGLDFCILTAGPEVPIYDSPHFKSLGYCSDLALFTSSVDIGVLPIFKGSGVRMKAFDYLRVGTPLVATQKAIEGIALVDSENSFICGNSIEEFTEQVKSVYRQRHQLPEVGSAAKEYLAAHHDPQIIRQRCTSFIDSCLRTLS